MYKVSARENRIRKTILCSIELTYHNNVKHIKKNGEDKVAKLRSRFYRREITNNQLFSLSDLRTKASFAL